MPSKPVSSVSQQFTDRLAAYDPLLRLRWGQQTGMWRVERKIMRGGWYSPAHAVGMDDYHCTRDGYILVLEFRSNEMDERVFYTLWVSDMHRFKNFIGMLEDDELRTFAKRRQDYGEMNYYKARDFWTSLNSSYRTRPIGKGDYDPRGNVVG